MLIQEELAVILSIEIQIDFITYQMLLSISSVELFLDEQISLFNLSVLENYLLSVIFSHGLETSVSTIFPEESYSQEHCQALNSVSYRLDNIPT